MALEKEKTTLAVPFSSSKGWADVGDSGAKPNNNMREILKCEEEESERERSTMAAILLEAASTMSSSSPPSLPSHVSWAGISNKPKIELEFVRTRKPAVVAVHRKIGEESMPPTQQAVSTTTSFRDIIKKQDDLAKREALKKASRPLNQSAWGFIQKSPETPSSQQ